MSILQIIKKIPFVNYLLEYRKRRIVDKERSILQKEGCNSLAAYERVAKTLNVRFDVMFGTLLGAYREHSFIAHDDDIDMVCNISSLSLKLIDTLRKEGFEIDKIYVASDKVGVQLPMRYRGVTSDIYFMYDDEKSDVKHIFLPLALEGKDWLYSKSINVFSVKDIYIPYTNDRITVPFKDREIDIFANADSVLKSLYGDSYMIPKANAHANPPVQYFKLGEKYYTCYPIELFESQNIIESIIKEPIESMKKENINRLGGG